MSEEVASVPQQLDASLLLEFQSEFGHFVEHGVALLQTGTFWCYVTVMERPILDTCTAKVFSFTALSPRSVINYSRIVRKLKIRKLSQLLISH